jgi:hypothetical protein
MPDQIPCGARKAGRGLERGPAFAHAALLADTRARGTHGVSDTARANIHAHIAHSLEST